MSIKDIKLTEREEVFIRLVQSNENLFDACSKAGIILSPKILSVIKKSIK